VGATSFARREWEDMCVGEGAAQAEESRANTNRISVCDSDRLDSRVLREPNLLWWCLKTLRNVRSVPSEVFVSNASNDLRITCTTSASTSNSNSKKQKQEQPQSVNPTLSRSHTIALLYGCA
jgi:hypothetical protein